jgi:hypothetical protein
VAPPWLKLLCCIAASLLLTCTNASAEGQAFRILLPSGTPPHPAVLLVPGCSELAATNGVNFYDIGLLSCPRRCDGSRISVIGWSYGGGGVLVALKAMPPDPPIGKAVMYYPVCRGAAPWSTPVVGLMLLGAKDDVAYPTLCKPVVVGVPAERLRVVSYPDARHVFDNRGFPEHADISGAPVYNAEVAKASWAAVLEFLK